MTIIELYILLLPLIKVLGTICLILLVTGGTIYAIVWFVKKYWKAILLVSSIAFVLFISILIWGAM